MLLSALVLSLIACHGNDPDALYLQASQELEQGNSASALEVVDKALGGPVGKDPVTGYKFRVLKAYIVVANDPDQALQLLQSDPPQQFTATEIPALRKLTQGKAYFYKKDLGRADAYLKDARSIAAVHAPKVLARIAYLQGYMAQGTDPAKAEQFFHEALDSARQYKQKLTETGALINIGKILMDREQYDEAITELSLALELARSAPPDLWDEEVALGDIGLSYYELGDFERATYFLKNAIANASQTGRKAGQERWTTDLGDVYLSQKNYEQADKYYRMGYSFATDNNDWFWSALALHNLALVELSRNDVSKAEAYNEELVEVTKRVNDPYVHALYTVMTAELAMRHKQFGRAEELLRSVIANTKDSSQVRRAQSDLASVYVAQNKPDKATQAYEAAIHTVESARAAVKQEERRMSILDGWPFYDDYIRFLIDQGNYRKALQKAEHSRSRTLVEGLETTQSQAPVPELSIPRVQSFLRRQRKVIMAYWLAEADSYLWVVTPTQVQIYHLGPKREIEQKIHSYNQKILNHGGIDDSAEGQKLYELLVQPAVKLVPRGSQAIIIPHRSLYKLNFETLVAPGPKPHYWIDDVTLEVAGSMALLTSSQPQQPNSSQNLLLIGAPVQASSEFPALVHADEEIHKVAAHFAAGQEKVISHQTATPSAFETARPDQFSYIHFVTHGKASETTPLDSAIILSPEQENVFKLYARDIVGLKLNADVVTISACYGAGTKTYSGEGLVGLAWAFLRAGAHQVVAGLWEVDDRATPDLMDDFYTGLKYQGAAAALRAAKLKMAHSEGVYRLPYYWASLQLYAGS
ncbi:MAG TPA: CHAT domain-containing protein [Candidatus Angelobacter sp.]